MMRVQATTRALPALLLIAAGPDAWVARGEGMRGRDMVLALLLVLLIRCDRIRTLLCCFCCCCRC